MKKNLITLTLVLLVLCLSPIVSAGASAAYPICTVSGCCITAAHVHNGVMCAGHYIGDGHPHRLCGIANCTATGAHTHNGVTYMPHHGPIGRGTNGATRNDNSGRGHGHGKHR